MDDQEGSSGCAVVVTILFALVVLYLVGNGGLALLLMSMLKGG